MTERWPTKHTLLIRARNQDDHEAWKEFISYYKDFIHTVLFQLKTHPSEVDDLSQDILVQIWKALPNFAHDKERGLFRNWLSRLIYNLVSKHIRKNQRRENKHNKAEGEADIHSEMMDKNAVDEIIQKEWKENIIKLALKNITPLFSENAIKVFLMSLKGISTNQISKELKLTPNAVIKLKNRVKSSLCDEINHLKEELET